MPARLPRTSAFSEQPRAGAQEGCGESLWGQAGGRGGGPCGPNAAPVQGGRGSSLATERRRPAQGPPLTTHPTARLHEGLLPHPLQLVDPVLCMAWAGQVTAALSLDESLSGPCLTGLLSDHGWLEPPRWLVRLLRDLGAPKVENGTQGHVGVVTRGGRGAGGPGHVLGGPSPSPSARAGGGAGSPGAPGIGASPCPSGLSREAVTDPPSGTTAPAENGRWSSPPRCPRARQETRSCSAERPCLRGPASGLRASLRKQDQGPGPQSGLRSAPTWRGLGHPSKSSWM